MDFKINSCGIWDCAPDWSWLTAPKGFADYDLWTVFRGKGNIRDVHANDGGYDVHAGVSVMLEPHKCYMGSHDPSQPLLVINVHFEVCDESGNSISPYHLNARELSDAELMRKLLQRVVSCYNANDTEGACAYLKCALEEFSRSPQLNGDNDKWVSISHEICSRIDMGALDTLASYANQYGYTQRHLGKMFHQVTGVSFSDYFQSSRMGRAKLLLRQTDMPVYEIAEALGFYDACHFTRAFVKATGISPQKFRK